MMKEEENEPQPLRIIGIPKRKNGKYVLDEFAILGKECGWICPRCNNEVRICPTKAGMQSFMCKSCNAIFEVRVDADADTFLVSKKKSAAPIQAAAAVAAAAKGAAAAVIAQQQVQKPAKGILLVPEEPVVKRQAEQQPAPVVKAQQQSAPTTNNDDDNETVMVAHPKSAGVSNQATTNGVLQWGGFFSRKRYELRAGANIVGRSDKGQPSDLEFSDPEMSRRSVKIDAMPDGNGSFIFTLCVLKSLNPVTINGRQVTPGVIVKLNHNDSIVMGKTSLTFKLA